MDRQTTLLQAGTTSVEFEPQTGFLRRLSGNGKELVRTVYLAVRDSGWGTAPNEVRDFTFDGSSAAWRLISRRGPHHVVWECKATVEPGRFRFEAAGTAMEDFETCRTGLCLLHPSSHAGAALVVGHSDGGYSRQFLPRHVSPHQPIFDIRSMHLDVPGFGPLTIVFEGEIFETEDQRNWSDDSFKTYCRPLDWPKPYPIKRGEQIRHAVTVRFEPDAAQPSSERDRLAKAKPTPALEHDEAFTCRLGCLLGDSGEPAAWQVERLRRLRLGHLAVVLGSRWREEIERGARVAEAIGLRLQIHLRAPLTDELADRIAAARPLEVLVDPSVDPGPLRSRKVAVIGASRHNFTELNRQPPEPGRFDGVGFALNPQVHAFDDRSIMETVGTHALLLEEAQSIALGGQAHVGPVTFESFDRPEKDARLGTELAAAWTLASVRAIASAGSATYFRTHGPGGVLPEAPETTSPLERLFLALSDSRALRVLSFDRPLLVGIRTPRGDVVANIADFAVAGIPPHSMAWPSEG
ncbi:MAG TPA: hypothetical protein VGE01_03755 [Fimbriimonas sp.]